MMYPRMASWGRDKLPARLTLIGDGHVMHALGPLNTTVDDARRLIHQANMTQKHIAGGCRGPRPKT